MAKKIIWALMGFILVMMFGVTALRLPRQIKFLTDLMLGVLTCLSVGRFVTMSKRGSNKLLWFVGVFFLYTLVIYFTGERNPFYYFTGLRNNFRHYVFFFACTCWLEREDYKGILHMFEAALYLNVIACSLQYWVYHMPFDNICGLFGTTVDGSGYMNILMIIVTTFGMLQYMEKKISTPHVIAILVSNVWIAIISETKAYYFELIMIIGLTLLLHMKKGHRKKLFLLAAVCLSGLILIEIYTVLLKPEYWAGFFSPAGVWEEMTRASGYSGSGDLNRLTAIPVIFKDIFHGGPRALIGFGLGNCEASGFFFESTPFYEVYEPLHYMWFSISMLFLETGFIGLLMYNLFFCFVAKQAWQLWKSEAEDQRWLNRGAFIIAICCFLLQIYNVSLKNESGYMIYLILSIPYALSQKGKSEVK